MVDESETLNHRLKDIEQINLILKKLLKANTGKNFTSNQSNQDPFSKDDELGQMENLTSKLNEKLEAIKNSGITSDFRTKIHHELRTPLVPVKAYTDMLLEGHYGKLTDLQLEKINHIKNNINQLENALSTLFTKESFQNLNQNQKDKSHKIKELEQEKELLKKLDRKQGGELESSRQEIDNLQNKFSDLTHKVREQEQEKQFLKKSIEHEEQKSLKLSKKHYLTIVVSALVIAVTVSSYSVYVVNLIGQQYRVPNPQPVASNYIIQNLQGDTIDTWLAWRITDGETLHVNIVNGQKYPEKVEVIKDAILSIEFYEIDDSLTHKGPAGSTSLYYVGWAGALEKSSQTPTTFYIPEKFEIIESSTGSGDITIRLDEHRSGDGYSGWTKSIADSSQNQILKTDITIYDVNNLSNDQLATIIRHEFGHALGLAHSTASEDLMAPRIKTEFPYISECDLGAIISLYDGSKNSEVICEK